MAVHDGSHHLTVLVVMIFRPNNITSFSLIRPNTYTSPHPPKVAAHDSRIAPSAAVNSDRKGEEEEEEEEKAVGWRNGGSGHTQLSRRQVYLAGRKVNHRPVRGSLRSGLRVGQDFGVVTFMLRFALHLMWSFVVCSRTRSASPLPDASLYSPPKGKVDNPITLFEAGLFLPTTDFFNLIIWEYEFSVRELSPIAINKIVVRTLSRRRGIPTFIHDKKSKNNWLEKFLWVNNDIIVLSYLRAKVYVDRAPTLFSAYKELDDIL
ncbi:unnamed protein product [Lactuca saligna]|uniref:Uncharacterized protein n=1 Tax=Lactuca saligna TaxID=75948 RepID=A0AA35VIX8_LACSI|nr:unnamed protein product [Lactuca saligna]